MSFELRNANCLDSAVGMPSLADKSIDCIITDAPYSEHVHGNARTNAAKPNTDGNRPPKELKIEFAFLDDGTRRQAASEFARLARRWVLVFCEAEGTHLWRVALECAGLEYIRTGFWIRTNSMPQISGDRPAAGAEAIVIAHPSGRKRWNGGGRPAVWSSPLAQNDTAERLHSTQKSERLMEMLIRDFTEPGELVLDPFAGSASTGVACIRNGRRFLGFEKDAAYAALASGRLGRTREQLEICL